MSYGPSDREEYLRGKAVERAAERSHRSMRECGEPWPYCSECGGDDFEEFDDSLKCIGCGQTFEKE